MVDFGEILETIGDFGRFQKILIIALTLQTFLLSMSFSSMIFIQADPKRHCNTDWIRKVDPDLSLEEQLNLTLPRQEDGTFSRCRMFVPVQRNISWIREHGLNETTRCLSGWVYDRSLYEATIVTDFDLVCEKSALLEVAQTVFMSGTLVGSLIFGPAAESFGRKRAIQVPVVLLLVFTVVSGLSPHFYVYLLAQFVNGTALGGYRVNSIVLATEWTGVTKRSVSSCVCQILGALGQCTLALVVYFIRDWRTTQFVLAGGQAVVFVYIWWIPESARWLLGHGRTEEAKELISKVAKINKREIPDNLLLAVTEERQVQNGNVKRFLTSPILMKYFFVISCAWFSANLGFSSLALNVGNFGLSVFLVQFLFGITEIPAHPLCILGLELVGRKISLMSTVLAAGLFCLLTLAFPEENAVAITALVTTGKFFLNWAGTTCMVYFQELFPTSVRQTAVGLGATIIRIAGLLSPLLNLLGMYHHTIPIVVFSSLLILSGGLVLLLPETRKTELPDSIDEAEESRKIANHGKAVDSYKSLENNNTKSTKF